MSVSHLAETSPETHAELTNTCLCRYCIEHTVACVSVCVAITITFEDDYVLAEPSKYFNLRIL